MPYKYSIKKGYEDRRFMGAKTNDDGTIESQEPLESPLLELIPDNNQPQAQATVQPSAQLETPAASDSSSAKSTTPSADQTKQETK